MKRIVIFILFFLQFVSAFSEWEQVGNAEKIVAYKTELKDFVINDNNEYIYTLGDGNLIKKWDEQTGNLLKTDTIIPNPKYIKNSNWIFLSSDAKTYITVYFKKIAKNNSHYIDSCVMNIYNIETNNLIDSIVFHVNYPDEYMTKIDFGIRFADYNSFSENFYASYHKSTIGYPPKYGSTEGSSLFFKRINGKFHLIKQFLGSTDIYIKNDSLTAFFINPSHSNWIHDIGSYQSIKYLYFNMTNTSKSLLLSSYQETNDNKTGDDNLTGDYWNYYSGFFSGDLSKLFLTEKNNIHLFDLFDTANKKITPIVDNNYNNFYLVPLNDKRFMSAIINNTISIYLTDEILYCYQFNIDNIKQIKKALIKNDMILSDNSNNLFKVKRETYFPLKANFQLKDSLFIQSNSIQFYNCSLGYPDQFHWDFGDGTYSNEFEPKHIYSDTGFFNVKLTIKKDSYRDSVIKNKVLYVMPFLKADFNYTITNSYPIKLKFENLSLGDIDSVKWNFGDSKSSNDFEPEHDFFLTGTYSVMLTIFSKGRSISTTKKIDILVPRQKLQDDYLYDISDTTLPNCVAVKGFENKDNNIIYRIIDSSYSFIGSIDSKEKSWEKSYHNLNNCLLRREDNNYTFILDSVYSVIDSYGKMTKQKNLNIAKKIYSYRNSGDKIFATFSKLYYFVSVINSNFDIDTTIFLSGPAFNNSCPTKFSVNNLIAYVENNKFDFALSSIVYLECEGHKSKEQYFSINNYYDRINLVQNDFLRLNDSILIAITDNEIIMLNNTGIYPKSVGQKRGYFYSFSTEYKDYQFNNLLKLNDTTVLISGRYKEFPMYRIINGKGTVIKENILTERIGEFRYASLTNDNNILFSGYCFTSLTKKFPYFVKTNDSLIQALASIGIGKLKDSTNSNSIVKSNSKIKIINIYPNPTNKIISIKFSVNKPVSIQFRLYNELGDNILSSAIEPYGISEEAMRSFDLSGLSDGTYYLTVETNGEYYFRKLIYLR